MNVRAPIHGSARVGAVRMQSWRKHPAITGEAGAAEAPARAHHLPKPGRYAVRSLLGRFLVINDAGNLVSKLSCSLRDAEMLAEKLSAAAEREERFGQARRRACMSCAREFMSEGIHNRLCPYCSQLGHSPARW